MSSKRRNFLKKLTIGTGKLVTGMPTFASVIADEIERSALLQKLEQQTAGFNMCGYEAPKLDKVRVGIIGPGMRGAGAKSVANRSQTMDIPDFTMGNWKK